MKKLTLTWKKIVAIILGALGIGTLTSCYGMPITSGDDEIYESTYEEVKEEVDARAWSGA